MQLFLYCMGAGFWDSSQWYFLLPHSLHDYSFLDLVRLNFPENLGTSTEGFVAVNCTKEGRRKGRNGGREERKRVTHGKHCLWDRWDGKDLCWKWVSKSEAIVFLNVHLFRIAHTQPMTEKKTPCKDPGNLAKICKNLYGYRLKMTQDETNVGLWSIYIHYLLANIPGEYK